MRIKLNLKQLLPDRYPSIYWLYVDITHILIIKQLKEKVQRVLKESRDIEFCLDNVKFLEEDDIHAINENEEITVLPKEKKNIQLNFIDTNISGTENPGNLNSTIINDVEQLNSRVLSTSSKKRVRKRTHKKKEKQIESVENDWSVTENENSIISSEESNKIRTHKRYKLNNEDIEIQSNDINFVESLNVTREIVRCDSPHLNSANKNHTVKPSWKRETPLKTKITKVPVFVRTPKNSTQDNENENNKFNESNSEDCDVLIVDWKNMSPIKINVSEMQAYDMIQFKILLFNEDGQAAYSSVITARIESINGNVLLIEVLSGIGEFCKIYQKFSIDNQDEEIVTKRELQIEDIYELFKLV